MISIISAAEDELTEAKALMIKEDVREECYGTYSTVGCCRVIYKKRIAVLNRIYPGRGEKLIRAFDATSPLERYILFWCTELDPIAIALPRKLEKYFDGPFVMYCPVWSFILFRTIQVPTHKKDNNIASISTQVGFCVRATKFIQRTYHRGENRCVEAPEPIVNSKNKYIYAWVTEESSESPEVPVSKVRIFAEIQKQHVYDAKKKESRFNYGPVIQWEKYLVCIMAPIGQDVTMFIRLGGIYEDEHDDL